MLVACTACPAQYSVPDAKIRGRKVRVTCKRCGTSFVVDATKERPEPPVEAPAAAPEVPSAFATPKRAGFSEHDEPTVIGQIPAAALEAERRYAQRTMPPPAPATSAATQELPPDAPAPAPQVANIASPLAQPARQPSLAPEMVQLAPLPSAPRKSRWLYWLVGLLMLSLFALFTLTRR